MRAILVAGILVLALADAGPARAESAADRAPFTWRVTVDNDYFDFWLPPEQRPDEGYTHGTELTAGLGRHAWFPPRVRGALLGRDAATRVPFVEASLRQAIYTPSTLPADRPFAGWLEVSLRLVDETGRSRREAGVHLGVTGPPSQADEVQRWFHRQFGFSPGPDWSGEIPAEPGIGFDAAGTGDAVAIGRKAGLRVLAGPEWRVRLGTDAVNGRLGLRTAIGWAPPGSGKANGPAGPVALYGLAAVRMDAVARDEFLDGPLFRGGPSARTERLVPEAETGFGLRVFRIRAEWRIHRREKEYTAQREAHTFATLILRMD